MSKMDSKRWAIGLGVLSLCVAQFAWAGNPAHSATFTLGEGYEYFSSKRHIDNTGVTFGIVGYNFTDQLGLEGLLGFFSTPSKRPEDNRRQVSGTLFALDGVYRFTPMYSIEPYVLFGPGVTGMNPNGNDANNEGNLNAGVGAQWFFDKSISFRAEARDFYTFVGGKNDLFVDAGVTFVVWG